MTVTIIFGNVGVGGTVALTGHSRDCVQQEKGRDRFISSFSHRGSTTNARRPPAGRLISFSSPPWDCTID